MFGNLRGWIASAVILLGSIGMLYLLHLQATETDPPGPVGQQAAKQTLTLPALPGDVARFMNESRDAGELYRQAIADFEANEKQYEDLLGNPAYVTTQPAKRKDPPRLKGVDLVLQGRTANAATIFKPEDLITFAYRSKGGPVEALEQVGEATLRMGQIHESAGRRKEAREHYEAAFSLGVKMFSERLIWDEADKGLSELSGGAWKLKDMAMEDAAPFTKAADALKNNDARAAEREELLAKAKPFLDTARQWDDFIKAKNAWFTSSVDRVRKEVRNLNHAPPGDMVALAKGAGDRTWRVEAAMALGRCKYTAEGRGNQIGARRALKQIAADPLQDPTVQMAAKAARDAKLDQVMLLGN